MRLSIKIKMKRVLTNRRDGVIFINRRNNFVINFFDRKRHTYRTNLLFEKGDFMNRRITRAAAGFLAASLTFTGFGVTVSAAENSDSVLSGACSGK